MKYSIAKMQWDIECCNSYNNGITDAIEIMQKGGAE